MEHLARDLRRLAAMMSRRRALGLIGGASLVPVVACVDDAMGGNGSGDGSSGSGGDGSTGSGGSSGSGPSSGSSSGMGTTSSTNSGSGSGSGSGEGSSEGSGESSGSIEDCEPIPPETAGPYPGDGTNGANALALAGIVRSDIRSSLGDASGVADGVPLTLRLVVVDSNGNCSSLEGYAVYVWHCDRATDYSMYTGAAAAENYLRGVQEVDASGRVEFTTIFPGCYAGRWPHVHFEIYESVAAASNGANAVHISQLAFPEDACAECYGEAGYETSVTNLGNISLATDGVFADGATLQVATVSGNPSDGYVATLVVGVP